MDFAFQLLIQGGAVGALVLVTAGFVFRIVVSGAELKETKTQADAAQNAMKLDRDYWRDKYDKLWDEYVALSQGVETGIRAISRRRAG